MIDIHTPLPSPQIPLASSGIGAPLLQSGQTVPTRGGKYGLVTAKANPTITYQAPTDTVKISRAAMDMAKVHRDRKVGAPGRPTGPVKGSSNAMPIRRQGDTGGFERGNTFVEQVLSGSMPTSWLG